MKRWNFKIESNSQEIITKLESVLGSVDGSVFNISHDENDSVIFSFRKRVQYPEHILFRNKVIVKGKIIKTDAENESIVELSFA